MQKKYPDQEQLVTPLRSIWSSIRIWRVLKQCLYMSVAVVNDITAA